MYNILQLTELLHKPLLSYINDQFAGRLHTIKPLISVAEGLSEGAGRVRVGGGGGVRGEFDM